MIYQFRNYKELTNWCMPNYIKMTSPYQIIQFVWNFKVWLQQFWKGFLPLLHDFFQNLPFWFWQKHFYFNLYMSCMKKTIYWSEYLIPVNYCFIYYTVTAHYLGDGVFHYISGRSEEITTLITVWNYKFL